MLILTPPLFPGLSSQPTPPLYPTTILLQHPIFLATGRLHTVHTRAYATCPLALCLQRGPPSQPGPTAAAPVGWPSHPPSSSAARSKFLL